MEKLDITIGILSWRSPQTIRNTLNSFKNNGLLSMCEVLIYFQEISEQDILLANSFEAKFIGSEKNTGIIGGFIDLVKNCKTKYFIFCENDFVLIHNKDETNKVLIDCINLLESGVSKVALRDREKPGDPLHSRPLNQNIILGSDFPYKIESLHFYENPDQIFENVFEIKHLNYKWYVCDYIHQFWSNNVFISKKDWLLKIVENLDNIKNSNDTNIFMMENYLIKNVKDYKIAGGIGLFEHLRLDR